MTEQTTIDQPNDDAQFMIQRIYVKDLSFETPNTPAVFQQQWEPELTLDLNTAHTKLEEGVYEVVLTVTATVANQKTTAFLVEVKQAGIFTIQGAVTNQMDHLLNSFCP
ncbi:MAG: protein-export chaperone SecB, partial [bacterium]|nr:protein-export chaperone SecB [bacterium]